MEIRRIQISDVPDSLALWDRVYSEGAFLAKGPPPEAKVLRVIETVVKEKIPNFVATDGSKIIGAVEVFPGTMCGETFDGAEKRGHLGIQIDSLHRGKGIGHELMLIAIEDSKRYGFESIELYVYQSNLPAIRLYEKLGFKVTCYEDSVTLPAGIETRAQGMTLSLVQTD
ncbi:MAG: GNAT family N-acetyltransferase [Gammaproteobacteria bacterium]|nr:GNAT family N-acetyltransferase [Gammaproteobacteria bacterium]